MVLVSGFGDLFAGYGYLFFFVIRPLLSCASTSQYFVGPLQKTTKCLGA